MIAKYVLLKSASLTTFLQDCYPSNSSSNLEFVLKPCRRCYAMAEQASHHNVQAAPPKPFQNIPNRRATGVDYFTPAQSPPAGTALSENPPKLFQSVKVRGVTFPNRIFVSEQTSF